ncbi:partial Prodigiosin synthesizing transferase PigC, partial [Anaerolineae bacterium]
EGNRLQRGEILIAPYTNPNWTPLFSLAAGIVMEEGGLLSHGAVIAREIGIPAVLQIKRATQVFRDGQMLCVDGTRGTVEVVG